MAQNYVYFDFGKSSNISDGNWNNIVATEKNQEGIVHNVMDSDGNLTNVVFTLIDSFDSYNASGTTSPDPSLIFPSTATIDSFFGADSFNNNSNSTGGFILSGLDASMYYSFSVFASRNMVNDNREALYTIIGSTTRILFVGNVFKMNMFDD